MAACVLCVLRLCQGQHREMAAAYVDSTGCHPEPGKKCTGPMSEVNVPPKRPSGQVRILVAALSRSWSDVDGGD